MTDSVSPIHHPSTRFTEAEAERILEQRAKAMRKPMKAVDLVVVGAVAAAFGAMGLWFANRPVDAGRGR